MSVMFSNLSLVFELLWRPLTAFKRLRDRAPVGVVVGAAWVVTLVYVLIARGLANYIVAADDRNSILAGSGGIPVEIVQYWTGLLLQAAMNAAMIVLFISVIYVPLVILLANLFERRSSFSIVIREEYAATASCALASLTASLLIMLLPAVIIIWQSSSLSNEERFAVYILLWLLPFPIFAALMTLAIGTIFRVGWIAAACTTIISFLSIIGMPLLMQAASFICSFPLLLIILLFLLRDRIDDYMRSARARQSFKQNLEAATLNPADASAHYNLGLLYQLRGEMDAAAASFHRAVEIDPQETDAHYQLGRIAREQGRPNEAIVHFEKVVQQDAAHSHHEIWRETALVYYAAGQYTDALEMLERFLNVRPSDAQARYWRGMTLERLGRMSEAIEEMHGCIETVKTAPAYKYRTDRQWLYQAQNFLRERQ